MGTDLAVVGEMTLGVSGRDLAVWFGTPGRCVRLDALEELGSGAGAGFASHVVADAKVVSRDPVGEAWLAAHGGVDPCQLADAAVLAALAAAATRPWRSVAFRRSRRRSCSERSPSASAPDLLRRRRPPV